MKRRQICEKASRLSDTPLAYKPIYRDQTLGNRIDCQEKTFKSHGTQQSRTVGRYEALRSDFVAVQS
jgi:hypothetical protein